MRYLEKELVHFYQFEVFGDFSERLVHGLSSRHGGVSEGCFESLNLGIGLGDEEENLEENYERFCKGLGVRKSDLVFAYQEHTDRVLVV